MSYRERDVWVAKSLEPLKTQAGKFRIFSELPETLACRARYDNSPHAALLPENREAADDPMLVATTSGTPALFAARGYDEVWVGALTNFSALIRALAREERNITLLPAADPASDHVEDGIVAQDIAIALDGFCLDDEFVQSCGKKSVEKILASGRKEFLEQKLPTGAPDMRLALALDRYDYLMKINFQPGSNIPGLARVVKCAIG